MRPAECRSPATVPSSMVQSPPTRSGRNPAECASSTLPAVSLTNSTTSVSFCALRLPLSGRQRRTPPPSPWSVTSIPAWESRPSRSASLSACGPLSWPGAKAPQIEKALLNSLEPERPDLLSLECTPRVTGLAARDSGLGCQDPGSVLEHRRGPSSLSSSAFLQCLSEAAHPLLAPRDPA